MTQLHTHIVYTYIVILYIPFVYTYIVIILDSYGLIYNRAFDLYKYILLHAAHI